MESFFAYIYETFAPIELLFIGIIVDAFIAFFLAKPFIEIGRKFKIISAEKKPQETVDVDASKNKCKKAIRATVVIVAVFMMLGVGYRIEWQKESDLKNWQEGYVSQVQPEINQNLRNFVLNNDIRDLCLGVIKGSEKYLTCLSQSEASDKFLLDGSSVFEIGSLTKPITQAIMLSVLEKNDIELNSSIASFLPESVIKENPTLGEVTWLQLANHSSGLSRMPIGWNWPTISSQLAFLGFGDPFKGLTTDYVYRYLATANPNTEEEYANYSNLGVGLLGLLLSNIEEKNYSQLLFDQVSAPLGMSTTHAEIPADRHNLVHGYGRYTRAGNFVISAKADRWTFSDALAGAGAANSSLNDMMIFLNERMHAYKKPTYQQAYDRTPTKSGGQINLGWIVKELSLEDPVNVVFHDGATGGFRSYMGFDAISENGIVILANGTRSVIPLGHQILEELISSSQD